MMMMMVMMMMVMMMMMIYDDDDDHDHDGDHDDHDDHDNDGNGGHNDDANRDYNPNFYFRAEKIYEDYNQFRTVINKEGRIHWEPGGVFKTMCTIDITYYPFDEQTCEMMFGAWSYHTSKMNLTNSSATINMDSYKINGEWEIYGTEVIRNEFFYECCPNERFANIGFLIYLRRRHTFYVLNIILPSIMTSVLLLSVFFCTPGQKVQIGVVVLLSFRIFLINVSAEIPKTSDHIPLLGEYHLLFCVIFCSRLIELYMATTMAF